MYILILIGVGVGKLEDFYRNKEQSENDVRKLLERRRVELWSKIIAATVQEKVALHSAANGDWVNWVSIGSDTVVSWMIVNDAEYNSGINLFQDGRFARVKYDSQGHAGYSYERPGKISEWLGGEYPTSGLNYWDLSKLFNDFMTTGPFVSEVDSFRSCITGNWEKPVERDALMRRFGVA